MGRKKADPEKPTRKSTRLAKITQAEEVVNPPAQKKAMKPKVPKTVKNTRRLAEEKKKKKKRNKDDGDSSGEDSMEVDDSGGAPVVSDFDLTVLYENSDINQVDQPGSPVAEMAVSNPVNPTNSTGEDAEAQGVNPEWFTNHENLRALFLIMGGCANVTSANHVVLKIIGEQLGAIETPDPTNPPPNIAAISRILHRTEQLSQLSLLQPSDWRRIRELCDDSLNFSGQMEHVMAELISMAQGDDASGLGSQMVEQNVENGQGPSRCDTHGAPETSERAQEQALAIIDEQCNNDVSGQQESRGETEETFPMAVSEYEQLEMSHEPMEDIVPEVGAEEEVIAESDSSPAMIQPGAPSCEAVVVLPAVTIDSTSTATSLSDVQEISPTTPNVDTNDVQLVPPPTPTTPTTRFLIHYYNENGSTKPPTQEDIIDRLAEIGIFRIPSNDVIVDGKKPMNIGLKDSPVCAVRFGIQSASSRDIILEYMKTDEHMERVRATIHKECEMVTADMTEDALIMHSLMLLVLRRGNQMKLKLVCRNGELKVIHPDTNEDVEFADFCDLHQKQCIATFKKLARSKQRILAKISPTFRRQ